MDRYGISRANMFCLDEPDRHPGFRAGNDRTLEFAARSEGRLIPFVRLALDEGPIEEAKRCLDLGARGIKLHPRAQKFLLNDERLAPVFALAAERRVPILIHAGRGLPPIAEGLERLVDAHPGAQLILAHAGIADLANLAHRFSGKRGVFFDTSVWSAIDLLGLLRLVPPEQIVYASDYPYGQQPGSLLLSSRVRARRGLRRPAAAGHVRRQREPDRRRRGAARAVAAAGLRHPRAAARPGAHPPVRLDGDAAPLRPPAVRRVRRARARAQRDRGAERQRTARSSARSASCSKRRATCGGRCPRPRTRPRRRLVARTAVRLIQIADTVAVTST